MYYYFHSLNQYEPHGPRHCPQLHLLCRCCLQNFLQGSCHLVHQYWSRGLQTEMTKRHYL